MSIPEVGHRIQRSAVSHIEEIGFYFAKQTQTPNLNNKSAIWLNLSHEQFTSDYCLAADRIIEGYLDVFAHKDLYIGQPPIWNKNILCGTHAPMVFGKLLNYRNESQVGDIKYLWEPARHLQLVTLAQAYHQSKNEAYLLAIKDQISSWVNQCPYMVGPHWSSSLELAIRLINWSIVWQLIGGVNSDLFKGASGEQFKQLWLKSIYQHMHFIKGHFSRFSSANNHLIGEAAGLFIATLTWPFWHECDHWNLKAKDILEKETLLQNDSEGVNREQTTSYQQFVLDFLILAGLAGNFSGVQFSSYYWKRIESMLEFIASIINVGGDVPMIGDADDGLVVRFTLEKGWNPFRSLLTIGAVLFKRHDFIRCFEPDDKFSWLIEPTEWQSGEQWQDWDLSLPHPIKQDYSESGYYVMGEHFNTNKEVKAVIDAGPLGYQTIAAHGHADALSFVLSYKGYEFIIDPGTYSYHTKQKWRDYFRGTSAHNTIRIDKLDQSVSGGNFMWLNKANAICEHWSSTEHADVFIGCHDGYSRLEDPVIHKRSITYNKNERLFTISDRIECERNHLVEWYWHMSEDCEIETNGNVYIITNQGVSISIVIDTPKADKTIISAHESPPLGWVSRRYDVKVPTHTLYCRCEINGTYEFKTIIKCL